jgi:phosphoribosyl 1,2-cyclic phosphodiesterase
LDTIGRFYKKLNKDDRMTLQFTVLASGSAGNASLVEADGFGLLLDLGLGPRQLARRLAASDLSWSRVHAAILTHTHTDHWNDRTLAWLHRLELPLYCHAEHQAALLEYSPAFAKLRSDDLVHHYEVKDAFEFARGLRCCAFEVCHDGGMTCGFRFDAGPDGTGLPCSLGYAADLGCWEHGLAQVLADVDVLALEFNHDVMLEHASGRSPHLIARVLSDHGHLSNDQAAGLLHEVLGRSAPGRLQHVVQLHLSRDCNRPHLALEAALEVVEALQPETQIHTALQHEPLAGIAVGGRISGTARSRPRRSRRRRASETAGFRQAWLPGWDTAQA